MRAGVGLLALAGVMVASAGLTCAMATAATSGAATSGAVTSGNASEQETVPASGTAKTRPDVTIAREALPDWIVARTIPPLPDGDRAHVEGGAAYLLIDSQVRGSAKGYDEVSRTAMQVLDRSGLESAGQVSIEFDPRAEDVTINFIRIVRDGKVIDHTADARFSVVEREDDLDEGIVSGTLKAIANLKDVRVGDTVDYAFTRHVRSALWPGQFFASYYGRYSDPIASRSLRILWPSSQPLTVKAANTDLHFTERTLGDMHEWAYTGRNPASAPAEDNVPDWYPTWGMIDVSSMRDWGQVARWASTLYTGDETLPADYAAKLDGIAQRWSDPADRLTETTRLVQDSIRYVGEEMGEGSYVPRRPAVVLARGYGDCKDKALLLAVSLKHLGIEAVPALVSTRPGFDLPDRLPSPLMFDHVIVRARLADKILWLDATATHRGGRGAGIVSSDFGYALPIRADQRALERMGDRRAGTMDVTETFAVDEKAATAMTLHVETTYTDAQADWIRGRVASRGSANIARGNLDFYHKRFAGLVEAKPIEWRDDRDANRMVMVEDYALSKADFDKDKLDSDFQTSAYAVIDILPDRQNTPRHDPLALIANVSRNQTIVLKALDHAPGTLDDVDMSGQGIHFTRISKQAGDTVTMTYHLDTDARRVVAPGDAEAVYKIADRIDDASGIDLYLDKSPAQAKTSSPLDLPELAPYRDDLAKAGKLMTQEHAAPATLVEALSILNALGDKVARPSKGAGLIDGMRGALLAQMGRSSAALTAMVSSTQQYQDTPEMFDLLLQLEITQGKPADILQSLELTRDHQPSVIRKLTQDYLRAVSYKLHALPSTERKAANDRLCTVMADSGWGLDPRTAGGDEMLSCAIEARLDAGDSAGAKALLAKGIKATDMLSLAVNRRDAAVWPDIEKARADAFRSALDADVREAKKAVDAAPQDMEVMQRYVMALRTAGRSEDAVKAARSLAENRALVEANGEPAFWLVNAYAYALADVGRTDDGLAQMDGLMSLGLANNPMLISQAINRASMMLEAGQPQAALAAYNAVEKDGADYASLTGKMWIWSGQACALRALDRGAEAVPIEAKLMEKPDENRAAVTMAAACRNDGAAIEAQILARLADPGQRDSALIGLVHFRPSPNASAWSRQMDAIMAAARARPAVQAKLLEYGRPVDFAGTSTYWGSF